ncbi:winged helix-turn-helix domain-containing protein [Streptomyces sp. NPDC021093]|uniref:winged helix-turn-helix domain-containing protein n=1 Tax=Streptomyces sp. NPDC021093 TaxID=3365112 RepID=UPI0037AF5964
MQFRGDLGPEFPLSLRIRRRSCFSLSGVPPLARTASRRPKLSDAQVGQAGAALERDAQEYDFEADLWTLERVGLVVERVTGVLLSRAAVWRLLTARLGWSLQRPERRAVERDDSGIARFRSG